MNAMMPCLASWIYNYFLIIFRVCCGEVRAASLASPGSVFTNTRSRRGTGVSTRDNTVGSYSLDGSLSMKQEYWNESHLEWSTDKLTVWDAQYHLIFPWENEVLWELTRPCTVHIMSSEGRYLITNTISLSISLSIQKYLVYVPVGQDNPQFKMSGFSSPLNPRKMMSQGIDKLKAIAGLKKGIHGLSLVKSVI